MPSENNSIAPTGLQADNVIPFPDWLLKPSEEDAGMGVDLEKKPETFCGDLRNLPTALAALIGRPNWVLWRWEKPKDKFTKVPYQPNGKKARNNDPKTWNSYDVVLKALSNVQLKFDGIGFCLFKSDISAFDIDNCRDPFTGEIDPWATDLVERVGSYTEITVSGTGLRIIGSGNGPKLHRKLPVTNGVSLEAYRGAERYIVITGNPLNGTGITNIDEHLDTTVRELEAKKAQSTVTQQDAHEEQAEGSTQPEGEDKLEWTIRHCDAPVKQRSEPVWWVVNEMLRRGYLDSTIISTLLDKNNKISDHVYAQSQPRKYAEDQVRKAKAKASTDKDPKEQSVPLRMQSSKEFVTNFVPPDYLIDGLIQRRYLYAITGPTGEGKTSVMLVFALHVERGWPLAGREIEKGKVLFLAGENPDDVRMRWIKLLDDMKLTEDEVDVFFIPGSFALSKKELRKKIEEQSKANGPFALIIVDTSAAFFEGDDDNSRVQMLKHAKMLRGLIDLIDGRPTVIVTIHPVKNFSRENMIPSGGGAFLNEIDGNLTCMKVDGTMLTEIHWQGKFRGIDFGAIPFRLEVGKTDKLKDSKGRHIWTVTARPITDQERDAAEDSGQQNKDKLLAMMAKMPGASIAVLAQKVGWVTKDGKPYKSLVQRLLNALKEDKLVKKEAGRWVLTKAGIKAAREVDIGEVDGSQEIPF